MAFACKSLASRAVFAPQLRAQRRTVSAKPSAARPARLSVRMGGTASSYAQALFDLGSDKNELESLHNDMDKVAVIYETDEFSDFLNNPVIDAEKKKDIVKKLASDLELSGTTTTFLSLLVDKTRIGLLKDISSEFEVLYCDATKTTVATVTSAVELEAGQQSLIAKKLQAMTDANNVKIKPEIDESLMGGFVVRLGTDGSTLIDLSVKGQLERVERELLA
mmetsp:Transcript_12288/g.44807  ORF Transcript_12288/g.44807 Transcript_12288/m.44807 type:complete len:221 (+) Transcript_12288:82-744(+)